MCSVCIGGRRFSTQILSKVPGLRRRMNWFSNWSKPKDLKNGLKSQRIFLEELANNAGRGGTTT